MPKASNFGPSLMLPFAINHSRRQLWDFQIGFSDIDYHLSLYVARKVLKLKFNIIDLFTIR